MARKNPFFDVLKSNRHQFQPDEISLLFNQVNRKRIEKLQKSLSSYISTNLPAAFEKRDGLSDYRTNPYVLMTTASVMNLDDPATFGSFLFNSKLYMALETSFGKSIEAAFVGQYPISSKVKWGEPKEKLDEFAKLSGLSREEKAQVRTQSVWREIDKSCVFKKRRYLTTIKSGPNTINDTQVQAMTRAIIDNHKKWAKQTRRNEPSVKDIDIIVGLTYGTDKTTNNKENQILVKLLDNGFVEEDRNNNPGVLIDSATRSVRVYRCIGKDFWAFIGNPKNPEKAPFVFLEILLGLAKALSTGMKEADLETRINRKIQQLSIALSNLRFPRKSLPDWIRDDFSEDELFWFATAMTAFYDEGI
ncbi:hypothetical protein JYT29_03425 [Nitrospina gracilis]|nr:hypothetical protein [Nitrospina gracilis]